MGVDTATGQDHLGGHLRRHGSGQADQAACAGNEADSHLAERELRVLIGDDEVAGQGYLAACTGIISSCASIASGAVYAHYGEGVYYMMAAMAGTGAVIMWLARHKLAHHPHSAASGG